MAAEEERRSWEARGGRNDNEEERGNKKETKEERQSRLRASLSQVEQISSFFLLL